MDAANDDKMVAELQKRILSKPRDHFKRKHQEKLTDGVAGLSPVGEQRPARCTTHSIERTSPIGEAFVGRCVQCGKEGLSIRDVDGCPNPEGVSEDESLLRAIEGPLAARMVSVELTVEEAQAVWQWLDTEMNPHAKTAHTKIVQALQQGGE
jgi:hypothetical protein